MDKTWIKHGDSMRCPLFFEWPQMGETFEATSVSNEGIGPIVHGIDLRLIPADMEWKQNMTSVKGQAGEYPSFPTSSTSTTGTSVPAFDVCFWRLSFKPWYKM